MISTNLQKVLESFTIESFQENFDKLLERVENGESFIITSEHGNVVITPYEDHMGQTNIFCDHDDGC